MLVPIEPILPGLLRLDELVLGLGHALVVRALVDRASHLEVLKFNFNFLL